ncbi:amidohydrolase family protein [Microbacterium sp. NPDC055683]
MIRPFTLTGALLLPVTAEPFAGWMAVGADGRIAGLGEGEPAVVLGDRVDVSGCLVAPGFVSAHSHLFTAGMRGMTPDSTLYPWVAAQTDFMAGADEDDVYWATLHGAIDAMRAGVTSAYNFLSAPFVTRYDPGSDSRTLLAHRGREFTHRQIAAARDAGLRMQNAMRLDPILVDRVESDAAFDAAVAYLGSEVPDDLSLGASVFGAVQWAEHAVQAEVEVSAMDRHGIGNQAHLLETAEALDQQRAKLDWYRDAGALRPGFLAGHFIHPDDAIVDLLADAGAGMVWQPMSNGRLGSGIADIPAYLARGMSVGMGVDDQSCTDLIDPFENMRTGLGMQRAAARDAAVLSARDVLRLHTLGGAEAMGVAGRVGSLDVGKHADFLVVDPARPDTGPVWDATAHYVLACGQQNVAAVYSGGVRVAADGRSLHPLAGDAAAALHERSVRLGTAIGLPAPAIRPASERPRLP